MLSLSLFGAAGPSASQAALLAAAGASAAPDAGDVRAVLAAARVAAALPGDDDEWFAGCESALWEPTGARLEVAALSAAVVAAAAAGEAALLAALADRAAALAPPDDVADPEDGAETPEKRLLAWAADRGAACAFRGARFGGRVRGAAFATPTPAGAALARIPAALLFTPAAAAATDIGRALAALPGVGADDRFVVACLVDAADPDSPRAPMWGALARADVVTGLTVGDEDAALLAGTAAGRLVDPARTHVAACLAAARPALRSVATAFGKIVPGLDAALSDAAYVRMVALAYGWTHETVFVTASATPGTAPTPPAHPTPAFVPPLFLANHAPVPHAVAYGRVQGGAFEVVSLRAGTPGSAFTLGYGRGTTANKALAYYGFVPAEDGDSGVLVSVGGREVCVRRAAARSRGALAAARRAAASPGELADLESGAACAWTGRGLGGGAEARARAALAAPLAAEEHALRAAAAAAAARPGPWAEAVREYCQQCLGVCEAAAKWLAAC